MKNAVKGGDLEEQVKTFTGKKKETSQFQQMLLPVELIKRVKREEGQYLEKSVQHRRRGLQPNSNTATGDQLLTHRTGTNPDVFLLGVLDALVSAFVLQHLQGATEQQC